MRPRSPLILALLLVGALENARADEYTDFASRWSHALDGTRAYGDRAAQETMAWRIRSRASADPDLARILPAALYAEAPLAEQDRLDALDTRRRDKEQGLPASVDAAGHSRRVALSTDGRFLTLSLRPQAIGENKGTAAAQPGVDLVAYLSGEEDLAPYRVRLESGRFCAARTGAPLSGAYLFDLTGAGELLAAPPGRAGFSHASYVDGRPVAAAGRAVFVDGKLRAVVPQADSYGASTLFLVQALLHFKSQGAALDETELLPPEPGGGIQRLFATLSRHPRR